MNVWVFDICALSLGETDLKDGAESSFMIETAFSVTWAPPVTSSPAKVATAKTA